MGIGYQRYHHAKAVRINDLHWFFIWKANIALMNSKIQIEVQPSFLPFTQDTFAGRRSFKSFNKSVEVCIYIYIYMVFWFVM
jgi:hypothetical protein